MSFFLLTPSICANSPPHSSQTPDPSTLLLAAIPTADTEGAQHPPQKENGSLVRESTKTVRPVTRAELFRAIKLRAQRELARRQARKWSLFTYTMWSTGNESNPNLTKRHKSALFMEEYLSTTIGYQLLPQLAWQASYTLDAFNYNEFTDLSTLTHSLSTKLLYQLAKPLRLEAHYTFDDSEYPYDRRSTSLNQRIHLRLRHTLFEHYYHYAGWTYLFKQYEDRPVRNGAGTRISGKYRKDLRHTGTYEIGGRFGEPLNLRLRQEFSFNDSNDHFRDFYDATGYKVRVSGEYRLAKPWSISGGFSYELKRYAERVNTAPRPSKQRDYLKTYDLGLTYRLSEHVNLTYSWRYARNTSNEDTQSYGDVTNSLAMVAAF